MASPRITNNTPQYIGLRTTRYGPSVTNFFGGSIGAGVPSPRSANPQNAHNKYKQAPATMSTQPRALAPRTAGRAPRGTSQYGTKMVQKPGTTIVKISVRTSGDISNSLHPPSNKVETSRTQAFAPKICNAHFPHRAVMFVAVAQARFLGLRLFLRRF